MLSLTGIPSIINMRRLGHLRVENGVMVVEHPVGGFEVVYTVNILIHLLHIL